MQADPRIATLESKLVRIESGEITFPDDEHKSACIERTKTRIAEIKKLTTVKGAK